MFFESSRKKRRKRYFEGANTPEALQNKSSNHNNASTFAEGRGSEAATSHNTTQERSGVEQFLRSSYGANQAKSAKNPSSGKSLFELQAQEYSRTSSLVAQRSKKRKRKLIWIASSVLALLLLCSGGALAYVLHLNSLLDDKSDAEKQALNQVLEQRRNLKEPFYMMLIGSDKRVNNESLGERSDTNILMRVDPEKAIVTMISIPRDTRIEIKGQGTQKFNAAYAFGGAASTIREASKLTGKGISYYAETSFDELVSLVDSLGGVEVDVPELIKDPKAGRVTIQPGLQTLNGEAALVFARSRAYADGDFTRASNQRILIQAIINKMMSLPPTSLPGAIQEAAKSVSTNLSVTDIITLALQFKEKGGPTIYSAMLPSKPDSIAGISYIDVDPSLTVEMMQLVDAGKDPRSLALPDASFAIASALDTSAVQADISSGGGSQRAMQNFAREH